MSNLPPSVDEDDAPDQSQSPWREKLAGSPYPARQADKRKPENLDHHPA